MKTIILAAAAALVLAPEALAQGGYVTGSSSATAIPGAVGGGTTAIPYGPAAGQSWDAYAAQVRAQQGHTWPAGEAARPATVSAPVDGAAGSGGAPQAQSQNQGQGQAQRASAYSGGSTATFNGPKIPHNTPNLGGMAAALGNNCALVNMIQGAGPGFGGGIAWSRETDRCANMRDAAWWASIGRPDVAIHLMIGTEPNRRAYEAAGGGGPGLVAPPVPAPAVVAMAPIVSPGDRPRRPVARKPVAQRVAAAAPCATSCPQPN